ncbi:hypothetical protein PFISCL1PPCAC_7242, partial [Pristionchus fissidentatus]
TGAWQQQFSNFAITDRIGDVILETLSMLNVLARSPLSFTNLEFAADAVKFARSQTRREDRTVRTQYRGQLPRAHHDLRECCFSLTEAAELAVRSLISGNQVETVQQSNPMYPTDADDSVPLTNNLTTPKEEENAMLPGTAEMEDVKPDVTSAPFIPVDVKEEVLEEGNVEAQMNFFNDHDYGEPSAIVDQTTSHSDVKYEEGEDEEQEYEDYPDYEEEEDEAML